MSLYDDFDNIKTRTTENVSGWSSGIKLLQSQLQLKKAITTQPKRDQLRKASLAPVIDLKSKKEEDDIYPNLSPVQQQSKVDIQIPTITAVTVAAAAAAGFASEYDWNVVDEYDPLWPNEYEKVVKDMREYRERENEKMIEEREKKRDRRRKSRFADNEENSLPANSVQASLPSVGSGFAGRWESEDDEPPMPKSSRSTGGVAIAPPPSLQELSPELVRSPSRKSHSSGSGSGGGGSSSNNNYSGSSVAAKIMAKYGFKEGQGLGKQEQGMSIALQVEKTSKRGGRIIHEKEIKEMFPPPMCSTMDSPTTSYTEPSITEIMKTPSKVVLLRNMVGPGEVDDDLEPEVKDECNTKYGEVGSVIIHEIPEREAEESVRIFVEFKRIESAIKAVVDLNGRFFGGRTVRAGFFDCEKFDNLQLYD